MSIQKIRCKQILDFLPFEKSKKSCLSVRLSGFSSAPACAIMCVPVALHPCRHANLLAASHSFPEKEVPFRWHFMKHLSPAGVHSHAMGQNRESSFSKELFHLPVCLSSLETQPLFTTINSFYHEFPLVWSFKKTKHVLKMIYLSETLSFFLWSIQS